MYFLDQFYPMIDVTFEALEAKERYTSVVVEEAVRDFLLDSVTAKDLLAMEIPALHWVVDGLLAEGLGILGGTSKAGKTRLALQMAISVAAGTPFLGMLGVEKAGVLYLVYEGGLRRLKQALVEVLPAGTEMPVGFRLKFKPKPLDCGGLVALDDYLKHKKGTKLVILDTYARAYSKAKGPVYNKEYALANEIRELAETHGVAILLLHHTTKAGGDDPVNALLGSVGLPSAADSILVLQRKRLAKVGTLFISGRDFEESTHELSFTNGFWSFMRKKTDQPALTDERREVLEFLASAGKPMALGEIAVGVGKSTPNVSKFLKALIELDMVKKESEGIYVAIKGSSSVN